MLDGLDSAIIQFTPEGLRALGAAQALMMFIVSLYIDGDALREARRFPRAVATGLVAQWLLLPLLTVGLIHALSIPLSPALGLLLVIACPGGGAAGFLSLLARGSLAVTVSLSAVSTLATAVLTPLLFTAAVALSGLSLQGQALQIEPRLVIETVLLLMVLPLCAGLLFRRLLPGVVRRIQGPLRAALGGLLLLAILGAMQTNMAVLKDYAIAVAGWILLHNALALAGGYGLARLARLPDADRRSVTIGTGITNSGICLLLVFNFFSASGAMAVVAVTWSVWRLISAGLLALLWSRRPPNVQGQEIPAVPSIPARP